jgi:hypothetical protein
MEFMPNRTLGAKVVRVLTILFLVITAGSLLAQIYISGEMNGLAQAREIMCR